MKVLISAYACEPHQGSEPGVGWNWSLQIAKHGNEVHVVTRANNREAIEAELARRQVPGLHVHYLDLPKPFRWLKRRTGYYGLLAYYYLWQVALMSLARRLHRMMRFDLAHHVTFGNDWMPSGLCVLEVPFIWGPVGGSTHLIPRQIDLRLPRHALRHERIRRLAQTSLKWLDPLVWLTRRRATAILAFTDQALAGIPPAHRDKARTITHIGIDEEEMPRTWQRTQEVDTHPDLRVLSGGRLVHWKGLDLLIQGFARYVRSTGASSVLVITGEGEYRNQLERLARDTGAEAQIEFVGRLPSRDDVYRLMYESDLYALPTFRDGPPVAILEAMSTGLPILCLDFGSTRELVPDEGGIKIRVDTREQIVQDISDSLVWAHSHRPKLERMGEAARRHVGKVHAWDRIGDEIQEIYDLVASQPSGREKGTISQSPTESSDPSDPDIGRRSTERGRS